MDATYTKQLVLAKYLFGQGEKVLNRRSAMACGVAISHFQDAVEMLLWVAIKEKNLKCNNGERASLLDMWNAVNDYLPDGELPHRACMTELNKARVGFKHYGILPAPSEAEKFLAYARLFLADATRLLFGEDFESISLADRIEDEQIKGMLKRAEQVLAEGKMLECVTECAKAHYAISKSLMKVVPRMKRILTVFLDTGDHTAPLGELGSQMNALRDISLAAILGIPANDFFRYARLSETMPDVSDYGGQLQVNEKKAEYSREDVSFAVQYVTEYALAIQEHIRE